MTRESHGARLRTVVLVCTGNICRSPMAEALLRTKLARERLAHRVRVRSAGTHGLDGYPASEHAISVLSDMGIDITGHRARSTTQEIIDEADLLLAMTDRHVEFVRRHFKRAEGKLYLLSEMVDEDFDIRDPYGGTRQEYAVCALQLEDLLERGLRRITALLPPVPHDTDQERY